MCLSELARIGSGVGLGVLAVLGTRVAGDTPFATSVLGFRPAPGALINDPQFANNPSKALGPPVGWGVRNGNEQSVVSLGGFGGSITLAFDHTIRDDAANPLGLDAIVFGNAFWRDADPINPNVHWAECAVIEICRDVNGNHQPDADEPWYVVPGSHLGNPAQQFVSVTWDDDIEDSAYPPSHPEWIPEGLTGLWETVGYLLPGEVFNTEAFTLNPLGVDAEQEGIFGYADYTPVLRLGDLDADDQVDDPQISASVFYTVPDDPLTVGIRPGSGGGDAFDIAWALDGATGQAAGLDGFDFIRISNGVNFVTTWFNEVSPEIDAVADVAAGLLGDFDADGDVDLDDYAEHRACASNAQPGNLAVRCRVLDFDGDGMVGLLDFGAFQRAFTGSAPPGP